MKKSLRFFVHLTLILGGALVAQSVLADSVKVSVNGMVCGFCAQGITKKLNKTEAVENVTLTLKTNSSHSKQSMAKSLVTKRSLT